MSWDSAAEPSDAEVVCRFLDNRKKHFRLAESGGYEVKPKAFEPPPDGELSVFRIDELPEHDVWKLGDEVVAPSRGHEVLARADIVVGTIRSKLLEVAADGQAPMHPRHAKVVRWPPLKHEVMALAQQLAAEAECHAHP